MTSSGTERTEQWSAERLPHFWLVCKRAHVRVNVVTGPPVFLARGALYLSNLTCEASVRLPAVPNTLYED